MTTCINGNPLVCLLINLLAVAVATNAVQSLAANPCYNSTLGSCVTSYNSWPSGDADGYEDQIICDPTFLLQVELRLANPQGKAESPQENIVAVACEDNTDCGYSEHSAEQIADAGQARRESSSGQEFQKSNAAIVQSPLNPQAQHSSGLIGQIAVSDLAEMQGMPHSTFESQEPSINSVDGGLKNVKQQVQISDTALVQLLQQNGDLDFVEQHSEIASQGEGSTSAAVVENHPGLESNSPRSPVLLSIGRQLQHAMAISSAIWVLIVLACFVAVVLVFFMFPDSNDDRQDASKGRRCPAIPANFGGHRSQPGSASPLLSTSGGPRLSNAQAQMQSQPQPNSYAQNVPAPMAAQVQSPMAPQAQVAIPDPPAGSSQFIGSPFSEGRMSKLPEYLVEPDGMPTKICPTLVLPNTSARFNIPMEFLMNAGGSSIPILGTSGMKLLDACVQNVADGGRRLMLSTAGVEELCVCVLDPQRAIGPVAQSLQLFGRGLRRYGSIEPNRNGSGCVVKCQDTPVMLIEVLDPQTYKMSATCMDGRPIAKSDSSRGSQWKLETEAGIDGVLITACMLAMIMLWPKGTLRR